MDAARRGDRTAKDELIQDNLGLVRKVARRWGKEGENEDVFQAGCIGLWKAVERYDPDYGAQFSTYAVSLILGEIRRHLRDTAATDRGRKMVERGRLIRSATDTLRQNLGREPAVGEVAEHLGLPVAELTLALEVTAGALPLEAAGAGEDYAWQEKAMLRASLAELEGRERELVRWRYFHDRTQRETGAGLGLSQVQVCRLEKRILDKLRRDLE